MIDPRFDALMRAAEISFDPELERVPMPRVVQVTLYVGGLEEPSELESVEVAPAFRYFRREVRDLIERGPDFEFIYQSEELEGSKIQTLFYGTREITVGGRLRSRLKDLTKSIVHTAERAEKRLFWAAVIGDTVLIVVPGAQPYVLARAGWVIGGLAIAHVAHEKADVARAFREMAEELRRRVAQRPRRPPRPHS